MRFLGERIGFLIDIIIWSEGKWGELKKDEIFYYSHITISNIPPKAYEYIVNGKSAIEWVMERYSVTTHK
jgi:predicted helicase